jgi:hypothetical protein
MIRGRPYHPQTQGTVERANRTFKRRLGALQAQKGRDDWVALLPELALVINTTSTRALPRNKTPFEVFFGRKPRWIGADTLEPLEDEGDGMGVEGDSDSESDGDEDLVLTEIEARVVANDARLHAQMIKANSGRTVLFTEGTIATLQIPLKLRLATEPSRLPVRVLKYKNGQYKLQCRHGRLAGRFQGGELNHVDATMSGLLGANIRTEPEKKDGKEVTIKLPAAVAKENNRGTIASAQKAGRTAKAAPKSRGKEKGKQVETIAIDDKDDEAGDSEADDSDAGEPVKFPKPRRKPGSKAGTKRKQMGTDITSPRKLRKRA